MDAWRVSSWGLSFGRMPVRRDFYAHIGRIVFVTGPFIQKPSTPPRPDNESTHHKSAPQEGKV